MDHEFRLYVYIDQVLKDLGWDVKNPDKGGNVYIQTEFSSNKFLKKAFGRKTPENVIVIPWKSNFLYWTIEAKKNANKIEEAVFESQNYANLINNVKENSAPFATGIAGSSDGIFHVRTTYWDGNNWSNVSINKVNSTGFLTLGQCQEILNSKNSRILKYDVSLGTFTKKADEINDILQKHNIDVNIRAKLVAGIILALIKDENINIDNGPYVLVHDINSRIFDQLTSYDKRQFDKEIEIKLPNDQENQKDFGNAIIKILLSLKEMNIRSAIGSSTDALGQFYETFLKNEKYGAQMGIVMTPRHVTKLAVKAMNIDPNDLILDPTCGTGGFLVAALDHINSEFSNINLDVFNNFCKNCIFGIEISDKVFGLLLANMVFRGDGKSNIYNNDCLKSEFKKKNDRIICKNMDKEVAETNTEYENKIFTRVLMNPPFAGEPSEISYVNFALKHLKKGGFLFAILPHSLISDKNNSNWREELLSRNTVRAVIKMPADLFQPVVQKGTWGIFIEADRKHVESDEVFFGVLFDDKSANYKTKKLNEFNKFDNFEKISHELSRFLSDARARIEPVPKQILVSQIDFYSGRYDFAPEAYIDSGLVDLKNIQKDINDLYFEVFKKYYVNSFDSNYLIKNFKEFKLTDIFDVKRGRCPALKTLEYGNIPVITSSTTSNGIDGYYKVPENYVIKPYGITISANGKGGNANWHPYFFAASKDTLVCEFKPEFPKTSPAFSLFVCNAINQNSWRYDYYRKCGLMLACTETKIALPITSMGIDFNYIEEKMSNFHNFSELQKILS